MSVLRLVAISLIILGSVLLIKRWSDAAEGRTVGLYVKGPVGIVVLAIGAGLLVASYYLPTKEHPQPKPSPSPSPSASASPSPSPSPAPTPGNSSVVIRTPVEGQPVAGQTGVVVTGTASGLGGQGLWLLVYSQGVHYLTSDGPFASDDGTWSAVAKPIGGDDDVGETFTLEVVLASSDCSRTLANTAPNGEGDVAFGKLPAGCRLAATRHVLKTKQ